MHAESITNWHEKEEEVAMVPYPYSSSLMNGSNNMFESEMPISSIVTADFVGVILAGTPGARLYPLTVTDDEDEDELMTSVEREGEECEDDGLYKHLLPVAGTPIICHLVHNLWESGLEHAIVTLSSNDQATISRLKETWSSTEWTKNQETQSQSKDVSFVYRKTLQVTFISLPLTCAGSAEALVFLSESLPNTFSSSPPLLVMPGDLILEPSSSVLANLANAHRRGLPMVATTVLLSDIGEEDENGLPLKESSKVRTYTYACMYHSIILLHTCERQNNYKNNYAINVTIAKKYFDIIYYLMT